MKSKIYLSFLIVQLWGTSTSSLLNAQSTVSGIIRDQSTQEVLIGANVYDPGSLKGVSSDNTGYFNIMLNDNCDSLRFSYIGFLTKTIHVPKTTDTIINIYLLPGTFLEEVEIVAVHRSTLNQARLSKSEILSIPSISSEPDVLKSLQSLPGIQSQNEASSNLLVRGGEPGQNLFLIDNVPLYYVNHLGGFVSVFNPDIINDVRILKGGFPAKYGGRLSSIVDITMREGDLSGFSGSVGIGVTGINMTLEGPLKIVENLSYILSARKTLSEYIMFAASRLSNGQNNIVGYGFYDLNGKVTWKPSSSSSFQLVFYMGDDKWSSKLKDPDQNMLMNRKWGNILVSLGWQGVVSPKLRFKHTLSFTRYRLSDYRRYEFDSKEQSNYLNISDYRSSVQDITYKSDFHLRVLSPLSIDFGWQSSMQYFVPSEYSNNHTAGDFNEIKVRAFESALYSEIHTSLGNHFEANLGIRGVIYNTQEYFNYSIEPRLDLLLVYNKSKFNGSFMRTKQFSHMVFSSGGFLNNEAWIPSNKDISPSEVSQYSIGWEESYLSRTYTTTVIAYYKIMSDLVTFKEGYSNLLGDTYWSSKLESNGRGKAYGAEFLIKKIKGNWTGFISFELSKSLRQFDNINQGEEYVFDYDRPVRLSLNAHKAINTRWDISFLWTLQSGLPYTPAIGRMLVPYTGNQEVDYGYEALVYGMRNSDRLKPYHRLDLSLNYTKKTRRGRESVLNFTIYNAYNRQNPYFYFYNTEPGLLFDNKGYESANGELKLYQYSYFPIIPSVSYKLKF